MWIQETGFFILMGCLVTLRHVDFFKTGKMKIIQKVIKPMLKMVLLAMNEFPIIILCQEMVETSSIQGKTDQIFGPCELDHTRLEGIPDFKPSKVAARQTVTDSRRPGSKMKAREQGTRLIKL